MRVLILGGDGYLGWPTAMRFSARGHEVSVVDNFSRRRWHTELSTDSLTPIGSLADRLEAWREVSGNEISRSWARSRTSTFLDAVIAETLPEAIVHYGEQPSAPYSMKSRETAVETQYTNVIGTLNLLFAIRDRVPDCHLVKLGTMGEYGTPNIDIEEGFIEIEHKGRKDTLPFPKLPGSLYHLSKVHDSHNIHFACRIWGLRATDLNQGVVYGIETDESADDERLRHPLRLRRVLRHRAQPLLRPGRDRPPADRLRRGRPDPRLPQHPRHAPVRRAGGREPGRARRVPGLQPVHRAVLGRRAGRAGPKRAAAETGREVEVRKYPNPRVEVEEHYYNATNTKLHDLGLEPHHLGEELVRSMLGIDRAPPRPRDRARDPAADPVEAGRAGRRRSLESPPRTADPAAAADRVGASMAGRGSTRLMASRFASLAAPASRRPASCRAGA